MHDFAENLDQQIYVHKCSPLRKSEFVMRMRQVLKDIDLNIFGGL
jgi:hypothetical protein